ncbi:MAG TPA: helix-hairpin-helix domain-containing protein [Candidatus Krumholzibacteria bacterium]
MIGAWNLAGDWLVRPGVAPARDPIATAIAESSTAYFPRTSPPPAAPPRGRIVPVSFERDPLAFLSTAPADSLDLVPGVGPVLAARIIEARTARGAFASWDDVLAVKGIGPRTVARWQALHERQ